MGTAAELFALIRAPAYKILVSDLQGPGQCRGEVEASQEGSLVLNLERSQQRPSFKAYTLYNGFAYVMHPACLSRLGT